MFVKKYKPNDELFCYFWKRYDNLSGHNILFVSSYLLLFWILEISLFGLCFFSHSESSGELGFSPWKFSLFWPCKVIQRDHFHGLFVCSLQNHSNPITYCQFNYNDNVIASSSDHGDILLTNVSTGEASEPLTGNDDSQVKYLLTPIGAVFFTVFRLRLLDGRVSSQGTMGREPPRYPPWGPGLYTEKDKEACKKVNFWLHHIPVRRRFDVNDFVTTLRQRRVLAGILYNDSKRTIQRYEKCENYLNDLIAGTFAVFGLNYNY